ncbi:leucine-rich repeat extensin-like protein 3 [Iris pallida]|uniref:Leucine-rich repeat extensin-like protein 3 n=1 Tax=Iris pallida TaxID=29817 RepID=A0AAX6FDI5_IRIPA|nr:leucine-rich repeat extensin-like protein 3 [Iris pallida]
MPPPWSFPASSALVPTLSCRANADTSPVTQHRAPPSTAISADIPFGLPHVCVIRPIASASGENPRKLAFPS